MPFEWAIVAAYVRKRVAVIAVCWMKISHGKARTKTWAKQLMITPRHYDQKSIVKNKKTLKPHFLCPFFLRNSCPKANSTRIKTYSKLINTYSKPIKNMKTDSKLVRPIHNLFKTNKNIFKTY